MSVVNHMVSRAPLLLASSSQSAPGLSGRIFVRFWRRRDCHKLKKPEDKSLIVLGKVKPNVVYGKPGISDKQYPILMQWDRPVRIETCNPAISGDIGGLEWFGEVDKTRPPVELDGASSLEAAPPVVKEILSLEFRRNKDVINRLTHDLVKTIQRHPRDFDSIEVAIAMKTITIRNMQRDLIERYPYKNQPLKHTLTFAIASRRKMLEKLREQDYKKFEWLLEKLNLFYKPVPVYDKIEVSRKASIERLTDTWCDELKRHRLNAYRWKLECDQANFLREKAEKLRFIMAEEKDLGLEQTVTQEEIDTCLARAEEVEQRRREEEERRLEGGEQEEYLLYREDKKREANIYLR